jgi:hypothetical protein
VETRGTLAPAEPVAYDDYGFSVAVDGNVAVVGAKWDNTTAAHAGAAYVFRFDGHEWVEEQKLSPDGLEAHDSFGNAVAVSGNVALVGTVSGAAYVFRFDGTTWIQEARLDAGSDAFAPSVSLDHNVAVIGIYRDNSAGSEAGAAYVFCFDGEKWAEEARLTASDAADGDWFGYSVAVDGDVAAVGARQRGAVYLYAHEDGHWHEEARFDIAGNEYGIAVDLAGDTCAVGAPGGNAVYVCRRDGGTWGLEAQLSAVDALPEDHLGWSVSVDGDLIAAGVVAWDEEGAYFQRPAIVYRRDGATWTAWATLAPAETAYAVFGESVCVSGDRAVIGEPADIAYGGPLGAAYVVHGLADCNANAVPDVCDLADGTSTDVDGDGMPDECQTDENPGEVVSPSTGCGAGTCGTGVLTWLPASLIGWGSVKLRAGRVQSRLAANSASGLRSPLRSSTWAAMASRLNRLIR